MHRNGTTGSQVWFQAFERVSLRMIFEPHHSVAENIPRLTESRFSKPVLQPEMWSVRNTTLVFAYNVHNAVLVTRIFYSSSCDKLVNRVVHFLRWLLMFCLHVTFNKSAEISDSNSQRFFLAVHLSFASCILNLLSAQKWLRLYSWDISHFLMKWFIAEINHSTVSLVVHCLLTCHEYQWV